MANHAAVLTALADPTRRAIFERLARVYSADPAGIAAVRDYFEQFWQQSMDRFRVAASQPTQEET